MRMTSNAIILKQYTKNWFYYDHCPYIQAKIRRGGHFSRSVADLKRQQLEDYILPQFGRKQLSEISSEDIEEWLFGLKDRGLSHTTINHFYATLRLILKEAERKQLIQDNPINRVPPFIAQAKDKGTITQEEAEKMFAQGSLTTIWNNHYDHYLLNRTASLTGMRLGEIQALQADVIHENYLIVSRSWNRKYGEKGTKTGVVRSVPIPKDLANALFEQGKRMTGGPYIFSSSGGVHPVHHRLIYKHLHKAFRAIGISDAERKERNITFHSWRHYYNSLLRLRGVPDHITQMIIGHRNDRMTEHYTHVHPEEMAERFSDLSSSVTIEGPGDG